MGNEHEAKEFIKNAKRGNAEAQYQLARCYFHGYGTKVNEKKAFKWYQKSAKQGHSAAEYMLGHCYACGNGTRIDKTKAFAWYMNSAQQGDADAEAAVGVSYLVGGGVGEDNAKALFWLETAYSHGKFEFAECIGEAYYKGWTSDGKADYIKAIPFLERSAENGNCKLMAYLIGCYCQDPNKDLEKAENWIVQARMHMDSADDETKGEIEREYAVFLAHKEMHAEAIEAFHRSADWGNVVSMKVLAKNYMSGLLTDRNPTKAMSWYEKAADHGDVESQAACAVLYLSGDEEKVETDFAKAFHYAEMAAENGDADGQDVLAKCYDQGWGTARNESLAEKWFIKAANQGCLTSQWGLGRLLVRKERYSEAYVWFQTILNRGDVTNQVILSDVKLCMSVLLQEGWGTKKNLTLALRYREEAAAAGNEQAKAMLENLRILVRRHR